MRMMMNWLGALLILIAISRTTAQADLNGFGTGFVPVRDATTSVSTQTSTFMITEGSGSSPRPYCIVDAAGDTLTLFNGKSHVHGSVFSLTPQRIDQGFIASFKVTPENVVDASMLFVVQNDPRGARAFGSYSTVGYGTMANDLDRDHPIANAACVSFMSNGTTGLGNRWFLTTNKSGLDLTRPYEVTLEYDPTRISLMQTIRQGDQSYITSYCTKLEAYAGSTAHVGFTYSGSKTGQSVRISQFQFKVPESFKPRSPLVTGRTPFRKPLRIMPLGDTITYGAADPKKGFPFTGGYREPLHAMLSEQGIEHQFVGSKKAGTPKLDAAGQGSYEPWEGLEKLEKALNEQDPDLILLHIGINDFSGPVFNAQNKLQSLIEIIVTCKPQAHIIVAQISPHHAHYNTWLLDYNQCIRDVLVPYYQQLGVRISTVDQYANYLLRDSEGDVVRENGKVQMDKSLFSQSPHLNEAGYKKMAATWFDGIKAVLAEQNQ